MDGQGRLKDGEAGGVPEASPVFSVFPGPGPWQSGGPLSCHKLPAWSWRQLSTAGQTPEHLVEPSLSHSPHPEANTPLSPAGLGSLLFSFVILFCPNGRSNSELGSHPTGPAPSFSSPGCSLTCASSRGSLLGLPSSLHLVLPAHCMGPAGLMLAEQGGQRTAKPSPQWIGIQTAWVSPPVGIRDTKHIERF